MGEICNDWKNMLKKNIDTKDVWLFDLKIWKGATVMNIAKVLEITRKKTTEVR